MTSGKAIALTLWLALASWSGAEAGTPATAATLDAPALIARLKRPTPATTAYQEVRFVQMLEQPLQLRGDLEYRGVGDLRKRVSAPYAETTTIAAGQVSIERSGKPTKKFALKRAPALAGFLESFSATLAGDAARLAQSYDISAQGDDAHWQLALTPKDKSLAKHVREVRISGTAVTPHCFSVEEASGDASVMLVDALAQTSLPPAPTRAVLQQLCNGTP